MQGAEILYLDSIPSIVQSIKSKYPAYQYLILTDEHIAEIHLPQFEAELSSQNLRFHTYILPSGELNKSSSSIVKVQDFMFSHHFNRTDILIAFGGGLITDFGGYISAIYMRGIAFVNIPTTLLSMVDASIGGKTAINTKFGKNLIGAFYDAKAVYINVKFLKALDDRNFHNGFGEIIKAALLLDKDLFEKLEKCNVADLKAKNEKELESIIKRSIDIKLFFVLKDKKESHLRKLLNLGHTIGHGIEYALHEELLHGECLGIGMMKMLEIGIRKQIIDEETGFEISHRLKNVLERFHLPTKVPNNLNLKHVLMNMMSDKKNEAQEIRFVFIKDIGVYHEKSVAIDIPLIIEVLSNKIQLNQCVLPKENVPLVPENVGSKSITNRLILLASLGEGSIEIQNFLQAEDTQVLLEALQTLELCTISELKKSKVIIKGTSGNFRTISRNKEITINVSNSGLSARFLATLLSFMPGTFVLTGNEYMKKRPIGDLIEALKSNSYCEYAFLEKEGCLPIKFENKKSDCGLKGGNIFVNSKLSSQYVSALLLCAPYANTPVTLHLQNLKENEEITSEPYIDMTLKMMKTFGIEVQRVAFNQFSIPIGKYKNPEKFIVEPDFTAITNDLIFVSLCGGTTKLKHIGKELLQNDGNFPQEVLSQLGIEVSVLPDDELLIRRDPTKELKPITINMNKFTDCFIALSVIASQINGVTVITGISNQRFKECNRIQTICKNLIKCGIFCTEQPDGLTIYGRLFPKNNAGTVQRTPILIETKNDHRIAMAFTMLSVYFEYINHPLKLIIDDKNCVSKSYPEYYLNLFKTYGLTFQGDFLWDSQKGDFNTEREFHKSSPTYLILIGMRSVGKSSTARLIEKKFGLKHYNLDDLIEKKVTEKYPAIKSAAELISQCGWKAFRQLEKETFFEYMRKIVEQELSQCVICCGGGIVEDDENYEMLKKMENVVWLESSDIEEVRKRAESDPSRPNYDKPFVDVYNQRKERFQSAAKYILSIPGQSHVAESNTINYFHKIEKMKNRDINSILENLNYKFLLKEDTFFLCISLEKNNELQKDDFFYIQNNYTALEITISDFVVNTLGENLINPSVEKLHALVENLRHKISRAFYFLPNFEIIITLRTEGRSFNMSDYVFNFIISNLRKSFLTAIFDCEYRANNLNFLNNFAREHENIILSKHFFDEKISEDDILKEFEKMFAFAEYNTRSVKLFKMVLSTPCNNTFIDDIREKASALPMPNLVFKLGTQGRYSRLQAKVYLPVFDGKIMKNVIVGQLQKCDVINLRRELYLDSPFNRKYYVIGSNIDYSLSPKTHNALFIKSGLTNHFYDFRSVNNEQELIKVLQESDFIGASITSPFKKTVIKSLNFLVGEANTIGVVNTVVKCQEKFYGFNTDWYGIYQAFNNKINELGWPSLKNPLPNKKYLLILGAGATCETAIYIFSKILNFQVIILNRSEDRFSNLEKKGVDKKHLFADPKLFEKFFLDEIEGKHAEIAFVFCTIPREGAIMLLSKLKNEVLKAIFNKKCIACNLIYSEQEMKLLDFYQSFGGCPVISGKEIFLHQAKLQNQIFSGKTYAYSTLRKKLKI